MADLAELEIRVKTLELKDASKELGNLEKAGGRAEHTIYRLKNAVAALTAAWGGYKAVTYIKDTALLAARYETLNVVMTQVGKNAGYSADQMLSYEQVLRKTGISAVESRSSLTRLVQAHIDLEQASKMARLAQDAAVIGNINSSEAFQRLVWGIQSAEVEILRGIGLNVNFESSYQKLADRLGKTSKELTEYEKTQARVNAVMAKAPDIAGVYESAMNTAGKKLGSLDRYFEDFQVDLGTPMLGATSIIVDEITETMKALSEHVNDPAIQSGLEGIATSIATVIGETNNWVTEINKADLDSFANGVLSVGDAFSSLPQKINQLSSAWDAIPPAMRSLIVGGSIGFALGGVKGARAGAAISGVVYLMDKLKDSVDAFNKMGFGEWIVADAEDVKRVLSDTSQEIERTLQIYNDSFGNVGDLMWESLWKGGEDSLKLLNEKVKAVTDQIQVLDRELEREKKLHLDTSKAEANISNLRQELGYLERDIASIDGRSFTIYGYLEMTGTASLLDEVNKAYATTKEGRVEGLQGDIDKYTNAASQFADARSIAVAKLEEVRKFGGGDTSQLESEIKKIDAAMSHLDPVIGDTQQRLNKLLNPSGGRKKGGGGGGVDQIANQLKQAQEQALQLQEHLTGNPYQSKLDAIDRKYASMLENIKGSSAAANELRQQYERNSGLEKQITQQDALMEQARITSEQLIEIGETSGNYGVLREGWEKDLQNWQQEQEKAIKAVAVTEQQYADMTSRMKQQAYWRELEIKKQTAESYAEYYKLTMLSMDKLMGIEERGVWDSTTADYIANSQAMRDVRIKAYDEILAEAIETNNTEKELFAQVAKEAEILNQLQYLQQYGTVDQAYKATFSIDFGTYKSELTKAREFAVTEAQALSDLFTDLGSSITSSFSEIVDGIIDGTLDLDDALSSALGNVADSFMNCFNSIFQAWLQNQMSSIIEWLFGSGSSLVSSSSVFGASSMLGMSLYAQGGIVPGMKGLSDYSNSILTQPTMFAFAQGGVGVAGEAGYEAILPVSKMASGNYGVEAMIPNNSQQQAPVVNTTNAVRIVNNLDPSIVGDFLNTREGEQLIVNTVRKHKRAIS